MLESSLALTNLTPMKSPVESWDHNLYCKFLAEVGHNTKDCRSLKRALDGLVVKGFLNSYISKNTGGSTNKF